MWIDNLNPAILSLGPLEIRWYGLIYVLGFFLAVWWLFYLKKKNRLDLSKDQIWDFMFYLMLGVLIGSRLFEVFWEPHYYLSNPLNFFKFWQGGMSFHGGLAGIIIAALIYCRKRRLEFWKMADFMSLPTMFALGLGRIANFINGELVGKPWNGSWCVIFPNYDDLCRHPQVLYSALGRFLTSGWLLFLLLKDKFQPGFVFWNFIFWEGVFRFIIDFFREDPRWLSLAPGQWFSLIMVIISLYFFFRKHGEDWKKLIKI